MAKVSFSYEINYISNSIDRDSEGKEEKESIFDRFSDGKEEIVEVVYTNSNKENTESHKEDRFSVGKEEKEKKVYSTHTKFCAFGINKCGKGNRCIYAHTFKQLNPITCKWDDECLRNEKCYFKHSNETKVQYVKRAFSEDIKRLNIVLFDQPVFTNPVFTNSIQKPFVKPPKLIVETEEEEKERKIHENVYTEELKKCIRNLRAMYYDPVFEHYCWADVNEFNEDNDRH